MLLQSIFNQLHDLHVSLQSASKEDWKVFPEIEAPIPWFEESDVNSSRNFQAKYLLKKQIV
jgi:hypothetical protein